MSRSLHKVAIRSLLICAATSWHAVSAEPAFPASSTRKSEAEYLVPPQGGAFEVALHVGEVCILSFPDKLNSKALASSPDFEIKSWGDDGVAVRPIGTAAKTTTLALATSTGLKVNITLVVVSPNKAAFTLIRFKAVSAQEAFEAQLKAAVDQRLAPLQAELTRLQQNLDALSRAQADGLVAERLLKRNETFVLSAHERNDDHVIAHVTRGGLLGDEGYLVFEIENRSKAAYRLTNVVVKAGEREVSGPTRLVLPTADGDPSALGAVPAGATGRGIVVVRAVDKLLGQNLSLVIAGPAGSQPIRLERGITFR